MGWSSTPIQRQRTVRESLARLGLRALETASPDSDAPRKRATSRGSPSRGRYPESTPPPRTHREKTLPTVSSRLPAIAGACDAHGQRLPEPEAPAAGEVGVSCRRSRGSRRSLRSPSGRAEPGRSKGWAELARPSARLRREHSIAEPKGRKRARAGQKQ